MAEVEERKEITAAETAPTTPIISPAQMTNTYDEEAAVGGVGRQTDATNSGDNNEENDKANGEDTVGNSKDEGDYNLIKCLKQLDLNSYATKKTLAQAILDLALLSANASQLKYILTVGEKHEFYAIILWLVVTSIVLQVVQAIICIILAMVLNLNNVDEQKAANITNNICLIVIVLIVVVNVIITGFDMKGTEDLMDARGKS